MTRNTPTEFLRYLRFWAVLCLLLIPNISGQLQCYVCDDIVSKDCLLNSTSPSLAPFLKPCDAGYGRCVTEDIANVWELNLAATEPAVLRRCDQGPAVDSYICTMGPNAAGKTSNVCACSSDSCNGIVEFKARRAWEWKFIEFDRVNKAKLAKLLAELNSSSKLTFAVPPSFHLLSYAVLRIFSVRA
ncbi:hypothetical protein RvY_01513 [Ramazzottius varieornatus]|uniref:Protein quiver n=1 Tax=Ramazzottius varieornatus TaxID=947166 RepID=A0A1D1UKG1_RAMVA|nr:hypothetical protein RvY_01513 [Ramazzottius varieornatus]